MKDPIITIQKLSQSFLDEGENVAALDDVSFSVHRGEFLVVIGPSGCGKSTLLRILAGLQKPEKGSVQFNPSEFKQHHAMVFQSFGIFPWLTVRNNIRFGLDMRPEIASRHNEHGGQIDSIVDFYLKDLGLADFADDYPRELSGGMKQRVGLARALAVDPEVLLMDEPFSQLDAFTAKTLRNEVLKTWHREKMTVIMVTHLIEEAVELADRILVMTSRPGKVEAILENTLPRPRNERTPDFWKLEDRLSEIIKF